MVASLTEAEQATFRRHLTECALALDSRQAAGPPPVHDFPGRSGRGTEQEEDVR